MGENNIICFHSMALSLEQCCDRETKRHEALKSTFLSKDEKYSTKHSERLSNDFVDPLSACSFLYCSFLYMQLSLLLIFTNYNKFLQSSDPLLHKVLPITKALAD